MKSDKGIFIKRRMRMGVSIQSELFGLITTIIFDTQIDSRTCDTINSYLADIENVDLLIFDFSECNQCNSPMITSLFHAIRLAHQKKFLLQFHGLCKSTNSILEESGVNQKLHTLHLRAV
jgi:hypothetical protein